MDILARVSFFLPPCRFRVSNLGYQAGCKSFFSLSQFADATFSYFLKELNRRWFVQIASVYQVLCCSQVSEPQTLVSELPVRNSLCFLFLPAVAFIATSLLMEILVTYRILD